MWLCQVVTATAQDLDAGDVWTGWCRRRRWWSGRGRCRHRWSPWRRRCRVSAAAGARGCTDGEHAHEPPSRYRSAHPPKLPGTTDQQSDGRRGGRHRITRPSLILFLACSRCLGASVLPIYPRLPPWPRVRIQETGANPRPSGTRLVQYVRGAIRFIATTAHSTSQTARTYVSPSLDGDANQQVGVSAATCRDGGPSHASSPDPDGPRRPEILTAPRQRTTVPSSSQSTSRASSGP